MKLFFGSMLLVSALLLISCAASKRESISRAELSGTWLLNDINGEKDVDKIYNWAKTPELVFDANKLTVSGNNGCNRISGKYSLPQKGKISFARMVSTKMACPDIGDGEQIFMQGIGKVNSFRIDNDVLHLMTNDKDVFRFSRKP